MLEKRSVYFKNFTSLKMIKVECSSWFLRFVSQAQVNSVCTLWETGATVVSTTQRSNFCFPQTESTWDKNLKNQLLHSAFIILKEVNFLKYTDLFSNICRVMRSIKNHVYSKLCKWNWLFCYIAEYKSNLSRVKTFLNKILEEIPAPRIIIRKRTSNFRVTSPKSLSGHNSIIIDVEGHSII